LDANLPQRAGDRTGIAEPEAARRAILVVDDSRFVRVSLARGLADRFTVRQADSGERAWELLLLDASIGAVLSDLSMPGIDGFELLQRVRASRLARVRTLPFAVLSGADDDAQRARAIALGADRFAVKGAGVDELARWIEERLAASGPAATPGSPVAIDRNEPTDPAEARRDAAAAPDPALPAAATDPVPVPPVPNAAGVVLRDAASSPSVPQPAAAPSAPPAAAQSLPRLVPDPLQRWLQVAVARHATADGNPTVLFRLHAPGLADLPARLRRGVRSADALHLEDGSALAWLCLPAAAPLAVRLALRFGLLAAGRQATLSGAAAPRIEVSLRALDPVRAGAVLAELRQREADATPSGLTLDVAAGPWGASWQCTLPWPAARLLVG
jgi:DNA-binding NarL/FixJ family response regulator